MRRTLTALVRGLVLGLVMLATAAGAVAVGPVDLTGSDGAAPAGDGGSTIPTAEEATAGTGLATTAAAGLPAGREELDPAAAKDAAAAEIAAPKGARLKKGTFLVGASRASLAPAPEVFGDGDDIWRTEDCTQYGTDGFGGVHPDHVVPSPDDVKGWPAASPDCVYLGGFGIGPTRPARAVGHGGIWVRSIAVSNGQQTFVYQIADTVGWFARYDSSLCSDCGIRDVRERLATDLGIPVANIATGSTHTHAGADTYGGWGGIPSWYRAQLRDAAIAGAKQAVANLRPATIAVGETTLRHRNNERRDTYYSNADTAAPWLQARALPTKACKESGGSCRPVVATWSTFAGHPTIVGEPLLHADWPGAASRRLEDRYGGVGLLFEGGLGNVSVSEAPVPDGTCGAEGQWTCDEASAEATGTAIADDLATSIKADAVALRSNDMTTAVDDAFTHPVSTNPGLVGLGAVGLFDREFTPGTPGSGPPGTYAWSKGDGPGQARSCTANGPTVITTVGAHRIGELLVGFAPGEIFSNVAEVVKEDADATPVVMVLGQTNDALGYIIQSFEFDLQGNVVTEYGTQTGEYEEVFALDRCMGDHVTQSLLDAAAALHA